MFQLGKIVTDKASGMSGCLMNMQVQGKPGNLIRYYYFQPQSLNTEDGTPSGRSWITEDRIEGGVEVDDPGLPYNILGTEVEDTVTGFKGTATSLIYYINGCVHVEVQPKGSNPKTGKMAAPYDFDIRLLKGESVPKYNEEQLAKSRRENPSPEPGERMSLRDTTSARRM